MSDDTPSDESKKFQLEAIAAARIATEASQRANEATIKLLQLVDEQKKSDYELWFKYPPAFFIVMTVVVGSVSVVNGIVTRYDLADKLKAADEYRREIKSESEKLQKESKFESGQQRHEFQTLKRDTTKELDVIRDDLRTQVKSAEENQRRAISEHKNVVITARYCHEIISSVALGRDQLTFHSNPQRAVYYAKIAEEKIREASLNLRHSPDLLADVDRLRILAWTLHADALWNMDRLSELRVVSKTILDANCNCPEGNHYAGLINLSDAITQNGPNGNDGRVFFLTEALEHFSRAAQTDNATAQAAIHGAATAISLGRYGKAIELTTKFLDNWPSNSRRVAENYKAQLLVAESLRDIASFSIGRSGARTPVPQICDQARQETINPQDAELLEKMLELCIQDRMARIQDPNRADQYGIGCARVIAFLRRSCINSTEIYGQASCKGCAPSIKESRTINNYSAPVDLCKTYDLPLFESLPKLSRDKSFGRKVGSNIHMRSVVTKYKIIPQPSDSDANNTTVDTYTPDVTVEIDIYKTSEAIPLKRYLPFDSEWTSPTPAPAPAPARAPAPPARD